MDIDFELRFLVTFFGVVLLSQALLVGSWFASRAMRRAIAARGRARAGHREAAAAATSTTLEGTTLDATP